MKTSSGFIFSLFAILTFATSLNSCKKTATVTDSDNIKKLTVEISDLVKQKDFSLWMPEFQLKNKELRDAYLDFVKKYPDSEESPDFLFRAAELSLNELQDPKTALSIFERNIKEFPSHPTAADALFMSGFVQNNNLDNPGEAEKIYSEFLQKYPNHKFAKGARDELEFMKKQGNGPLKDQAANDTIKLP